MRLQSLEQDGTDLLLDLRAGLFEKLQKNHAEVERMAIRVPQFIHNRVQEAEPCLIIKSIDNLFEELQILLLRVLIFVLPVLIPVKLAVGDVKYDRINYC